MRTRRWYPLLLLMFTGNVVQAHHAFTPVYIDKEVITVAGVVKEFRFVNPHALMILEVEDSGRRVTWTVEFDGRLNLSEHGWTAETIRAGEQVTVFGNPTHTRSARLFFRKLARADGSELLRGFDQRAVSVEEARRQRALKRNQQ